ncbi:hypothetical protein [Ligilactobacillus acidipiscis]|nr:hypothetical protein [Ligilactobacillus acidipiscis]
MNLQEKLAELHQKIEEKVILSKHQMQNFVKCWKKQTAKKN